MTKPTKQSFWLLIPNSVLTRKTDAWPPRSTPGCNRSTTYIAVESYYHWTACTYYIFIPMVVFALGSMHGSCGSSLAAIVEIAMFVFRYIYIYRCYHVGKLGQRGQLGYWITCCCGCLLQSVLLLNGVAFKFEAKTFGCVQCRRPRLHSFSQGPANTAIGLPEASYPSWVSVSNSRTFWQPQGNENAQFLRQLVLINTWKKNTLGNSQMRIWEAGIRQIFQHQRLLKLQVLCQRRLAQVPSSRFWIKMNGLAGLRPSGNQRGIPHLPIWMVWLSLLIFTILWPIFLSTRPSSNRMWPGRDTTMEAAWSGTNAAAGVALMMSTRPVFSNKNLKSTEQWNNNNDHESLMNSIDPWWTCDMWHSHILRCEGKEEHDKTTRLRPMRTVSCTHRLALPRLRCTCQKSERNPRGFGEALVTLDS